MDDKSKREKNHTFEGAIIGFVIPVISWFIFWFQKDVPIMSGNIVIAVFFGMLGAILGAILGKSIS